ncbi:DNA adenine methylase, partial [Salmonella enterica subsp. enterica serovar Montevideo]|nr:DNA adenine methylase [Salmonella enterica subsp. enterica serovar Montevideo]
ALLATLRQRCFFEKQLSDGQDNPLWRTVVMRDGLLVRRTCCQFYCESYADSMARADKSSVVYCDPPYAPLSATANFTAYHTNSF